MSAEQVVRDFMDAFEKRGVDAAIPYLADDVTIRVDNPPQNGGKQEFIGQGWLIKESMPDYKWGAQSITSEGNRVTVVSRWTGTHTGVFRLSALNPNAPDIPPTGKKLAIADKFIFTVDGDQITSMHIASPAGGGLVGMLAELGVQMPG
jgi:predicted ester cyclase